MKTIRTAFLLLLICSAFSISYSQVAVNTDASNPDASAMLDVKSNTKGLLIPRMLETERTSIASPAQGLMVYQTDNTEGFYYYDGTSWMYIGNEGNNLWTRTSSNNTVLSNSTDNVGIGTSTPGLKLSVNGYATAANYVGTIPLWQASTAYNMTNTSGQDLTNCESAIEPSIYEPAGNIEVKLIIRYNTNSGTTNYFQLRAHDGTTESYPITSSDSWTFAGTQTGGVATSPWKTWNAGTNANEIHLFGWVSSGGNTNILSAYLLVRPKQP